MALNKVNYIDNETIITANNLNQIQDEIINSSFPKIDIGITSAEDVVSYWRDCGNGYNLIGTLNTVIDQPQQYGLLLNFVCWEDVFQIWNSQPGNGTYFRSGNHDGWSGTWRKAIDYDIYPIGSIYMSTNSISPASLFGGTWEQIIGKFLLGADSTYTAGSTGGEATHTLTINEMPSHYHQENIPLSSNTIRPVGSTSKSDNSNYVETTSVTSGGTKYISNSLSYSSASTSTPVYPAITSKTGGDESHNNMPPYLAVYIWKRVS